MTRTALPAIGSVASDFSAPASDGRTLSLGELLVHRHVVLFFYPGNDTPG